MARQLPSLCTHTHIVVVVAITRDTRCKKYYVLTASSVTWFYEYRCDIKRQSSEILDRLLPMSSQSSGPKTAAQTTFMAKNDDEQDVGDTDDPATVKLDGCVGI